MEEHPLPVLDAQSVQDMAFVHENSPPDELIDFGPYPDPFVTRTPWDTFVFTFVDETKRKIYTKESPSFITLPDSPATLVWEHPLEFTEIWAPELHFEDDTMFLHYSADRGDNRMYRSYVATGEAHQSIGTFSAYSEITLPGDTFAIDLTRTRINEAPYYAWSGWEGTENIVQKIFIGEVGTNSDVAERHAISTPEYDWEMSSTSPHVPGGLNEGPQLFKKSDELPDEGNLWMLISADASWTDQYCLGLLRYQGGNPTDAGSWEKFATPVFTSTDSVFGPGHACAIEDENDQWWLVYHRARTSGSGWDRVSYAQKFSWDQDGTPEFATPLYPTCLGQTALAQTTSSPHSTTP